MTILFFKQHIVRGFAFLHTVLICAFRPFTLNVTISILRLTSAILVFVYCSLRFWFSVYFYLNLHDLLEHFFKIQFWYIHCVFSVSLYLAFSVVFLSIVLHINNLPAAVNILPISGKYRKLNSLYNNLSTPIDWLKYLLYIHWEAH